jgi:hypothetical protein
VHIIVFFHTDHKDYVAEKVGLMGWEIMVKWKQSGVDLMKLQPGEI